jgi:type IV secretion system protein VirB11
MRPGENTLRLLQEPLAPFLADPGATEVVVNRPGNVGVEVAGEWTWHSVPELDFERLEEIASYAAAMTGQDFSRSAPACSTRLAGGFRLQAEGPPLADEGVIRFSIRKRATSFIPTLEWLADHDYFRELDPAVDWVAWFRERVVNRNTFLIGGNTGSSKTTFGEALGRAIPLDERVLTIEKTGEWELPHDNLVSVYYGWAGDGEASSKAATQCLENALRVPAWWTSAQPGGPKYETLADLPAASGGVHGLRDGL